MISSREYYYRNFWGCGGGDVAGAGGGVEAPMVEDCIEAAFRESQNRVESR